MKLTFIILTTVILQVSATGYAQITLKEKEAPLEQIIQKIRKQSGYDFFYNAGILARAMPVTLDVQNASVEEVLELCFRDQPLSYRIEQKTIVLQSAEFRMLVNRMLMITGKVLDETGKPIPGASVRVKGANTKAVATNSEGQFRIVADPEKDVLLISYIGYKTQEIRLKGNQSQILVRMEVSETAMKDVVITGMMTRKKTSFTGATASFSGDELKMLGNQNIIQSLKTLDPSFIQIENNALGSNPNVLPTIELRGQTSISTEGLRDQFSSDPNQPLFILDGFESSLRTIIDLDMNTVASITILKDASSTAIYGSRASNGVIVIETKKPEPGKIRFSYTSDLRVEMPDLSSYNMMNAAEKLRFEKLAGRYKERNSSVDQQIRLDSLYSARLQEVEKGVNTYWLNKPIQTGFSQRHSVNASGGDQALRYDIGANIRKNNATMIGSKRDDWGANVNLSYRSGIFNISNRVYVNGSEGADSPYGKFSEWVGTNPYYRYMGSSQRYLEVVPSASYNAEGVDSHKNERIVNPAYNAGLNSFNKSSSFNVQNNFQLTADFTKSLRLQLNAQIVKNTSDSTVFVSPLNSEYENETDPTLRGSYKYQKKGELNYTINASLTYAKVFRQLHSLTAYLRTEVAQNNKNLNGYDALGFPNASNGNPAFAYGYDLGSNPNAANSLSRRNSIVASVNYSYDQRYNVDLNLNVDGSTAFGSENRYAPYYSGGLSWNINRERFMKHLTWLNGLRLRGNIGLTGNQNFGNVSQSVYKYYSSINSSGQGVSLAALGAPGLKWQKTLQTSLGLDAVLFNSKLNLQFNAYRKYTDPLVVAVTLPSSTGLYNFPFNAGVSTVKGIESTISFSPIRKPGHMVWTLGATGAMATQKYSEFNNKLTSLNTELSESNALVRYRDGYSVNDIWAVPSLGIDPGTGREVFLKKDGQQTFVYSTDDQVVVGNSRPKAEGVFSSTFYYKGFTAGIFIRYIFGRDQFNEALYAKVENISYESIRTNQDKRALYDRWQQPGDVSQFKGISISATTPKSSRFVQKENSFSGESLNLGYEIKGRRWLDHAYLSALNITAYSNDLFYTSTIRRERGINYPFARSVSMSIRATFK
ncbi:SusC/RagA family TonB-linked outer membrane protein [Pedobacter caeni]|uniref:SusC/RagA family TonB-linked outer membrane protein n=1 Tax=Pedobacter caeni TaxID=288992 RepID=UPI00135647B8|nr:SusC/RagA family TonB-linked outer membrane protein [Pedobacter caeni]